MSQDTGRAHPSDRATRPTDQAPAGLGDTASVPCADSGNLPGYYGILNKQGQFWSHTVHGSRLEAQNYIRAFWGLQTDVAEGCLREFQIIEVRVRLEPRKVEEPKRIKVSA